MKFLKTLGSFILFGLLISGLVLLVLGAYVGCVALTSAAWQLGT